MGAKDVFKNYRPFAVPGFQPVIIRSNGLGMIGTLDMTNQVVFTAKHCLGTVAETGVLETEFQARGKWSDKTYHLANPVQLDPSDGTFRDVIRFDVVASAQTSVIQPEWHRAPAGMRSINEHVFELSIPIEITSAISGQKLKITQAAMIQFVDGAIEIAGLAPLEGNPYNISPGWSGSGWMSNNGLWTLQGANNVRTSGKLKYGSKAVFVAVGELPFKYSIEKQSRHR